MKKNFLLKKLYLTVSLMLLVVLALGACQATPPAPMEAPESPPADPTDMPPPPVSEEEDVAIDQIILMVGSDSQLGEFLVDDGGMTLYMFTQDGPGQSNCDEGCLQAWPPLLADRMIVAGEGIDAALIGEGEMLDGRMIVTYNGMPLYYWVGDTKPGDTTGQGVSDVWYVIAPDGSVSGLDALPVTAGVVGDAVVVDTTTHSTLGKILVDSEGMTLYVFTIDGPNQSNCDSGCLQAWPPFLATGDVVAGEGVDSSLLGTTELADGSRIVTYNQMPLYYWAGDTRPGDTNGQNVNNVWFVVSPQGKPVGVPTENDSDSGGYSYPEY